VRRRAGVSECSRTVLRKHCSNSLTNVVHSYEKSNIIILKIFL
jgi:hypothetical protein